MTRTASLLASAALLALSALSIVPASAQDAPDDRATSFHAVSEGAHEDVPGGGLLVAAYGVALLALFGYVAYVGALQQGTNRELDRLEKLVAAKAASAPLDGSKD